MEFTKEEIIAAYASAGIKALAYIKELERRLQEIDGYVNGLREDMGFPPFVFKNNDAVLLQESAQQGEELQNELDGESKCGECVQLRIDSYDEPGNKVLWESMGYFITLATETPEEARTLYSALLTVKEVDTD